MIALMQSRWLLGLTLLALLSAVPAFAQPTPPSVVFTFDENGHGSYTFNGGPAIALFPRSNFPDPIVGATTLFYPLPFPVQGGFVGLNEPGPPPGLFSDVLHFVGVFDPDGPGVYFYSELFVAEDSDRADVVGFPSALDALFFTPGSQRIPELGSEGTNGATYVPVAAGSGTPLRTMDDPGFIPGDSASYNIISDTGPGSTVPEPSSLILLAAGVGLAALAGTARRRHRRK